MNTSRVSLLAVLPLLLCSGLVSNALAETTQAYVHFGAIMLGDVPPGNHNSRRPRVGYLPMGTLVSFDADAPRARIFNHSEDVQAFEHYIHVHSNIGYIGFIRDDLITTLGESELLLPLGYNINIRAPDSDEVLMQISRPAEKDKSTSMEITGEDAEYYFVRLPTTDASASGFVEGRISKPLVENDRLVKLSKQSARYLPEIKVSSPTEFIDERLTQFSEFVSARTDETAATIVAYLTQMNALRCRISSSADAELSAKIFGNGLGLRFNFVLAEKDAIYSIKTLQYSMDGQNYSSFFELHDVRCVDGIPHRLTNLILLDTANPSRQVIVSRQDLPDELEANWARFDTGSSNKMIIVDGFQAYEQIMRHIGRSEFLRGLPRPQRSILSHALLRELAHFSTPD